MVSGMEDNGEDDNFFADEFDDLPENAWEELEQNAIQSTQHPHINTFKPQSNLEPNSHQTGIIYRQTASRTSPTRPLQLPVNCQYPNQQYATSRPPLLADDGGIYDDAEVPTPVEDGEICIPQNYRAEMPQRQQWQDNGYRETTEPENPTTTEHRKFNIAFNKEGDDDDEHNFDMERDDMTTSNVANALAVNQQQYTEREEALRAQLAELIRQRDDLTRELHAAKSTVMTQQGEISIIRANQSKDSKVFDRQLIALKKSIEQDNAKHKVGIEAINKRSEKIANENQFLKHELKEEMEKFKMLQRSIKDKDARLAKDDGVAATTTPKKARQLPLRDGFDNDDIAIVSPIKSGRKSRGGTPTNAGKRKRKAVDASPVPALTFHDSFTAQPKRTDGSKDEPAPGLEKTLVIRTDHRAQKSLQFMQRMLNYRLAPNNDRILEVFSQFAFPSEEKRSFTSITLEQSASLSGATLPSGFTKIMIALWAQALKEKYYRPIPALIEVVQYILALEDSVINSEIIQKIIPVLQSSTDVNGAVRFKNSPVSHQNFGQFKETPQSELHVEVDGTETLDMLYTAACSCVRKSNLMEDFWRTMDSNFILMMLNVAQPISDLTLALNLLSTSVMPTTFGTIMSNDADQQKIERYLVDRVAYLLWEIPRVDEGLRAPTKHETYQLRMEALDLLCKLALASPHPHNDPTHHGSLLLATHPSIIGRLVRFIYDSVDALYSPLEPSSPSYPLLSSLINRSTLLLYRLLQLHGKDHINLHEKLTAITGGVQKHRVVLTRLAFTEGLYLESGIADETVAMAHEMLEEAVTPEEAEALVEVFPAFKGSGGSAIIGDEAEE